MCIRDSHHSVPDSDFHTAYERGIHLKMHLKFHVFCRVKKSFLHSKLDVYKRQSDANGTDFGNYLTYLYLSHYVDGPGRAPTAND